MSNWFQAFAFKCNSYRYSAGLAIGRTQLDHSIVVYDMTGFLRKHPGGFARVRRNCGKVNCTWEMRYKGGGNRLYTYRQLTLQPLHI